MELRELEEGYLISMVYDHNKLYLELSVLSADGGKAQVVAFNNDSSPIEVSFTGLNLRAGLSTLEGVPMLGEIESIRMLPNGACIEGDFGAITILASQIEVEALTTP
jgi:hypothetical protein